MVVIEIDRIFNEYAYELCLLNWSLHQNIQ